LQKIECEPATGLAEERSRAEIESSTQDETKTTEKGSPVSLHTVQFSNANFTFNLPQNH
jgi:hypothetical protein